MTARAVITPDWRSAVRAMAGTCTLRDASEDVGVSYETLRVFAKSEGLTFLAPDCLSVPEPVEMEEGARMRMLAALFASERRRLARGPLNRRLLELTAADSGSGDVAAALAKLRAA